MMNFLLDGDGQEVWRDVLVNLDAKYLSDSKTASTTQNENHSFPFLLPRSQARHHFRGKGRGVLFFLLDDWHVNELVVPLSRVTAHDNSAVLQVQ
jgi:hypothetical protein